MRALFEFAHLVRALLAVSLGRWEYGASGCELCESEIYGFGETQTNGRFVLNAVGLAVSHVYPRLSQRNTFSQAYIDTVFDLPNYDFPTIGSTLVSTPLGTSTSLYVCAFNSPANATLMRLQTPAGFGRFQRKSALRNQSGRSRCDDLMRCTNAQKQCTKHAPRPSLHKKN